MTLDRTVLILQARMGSTRLPRKTMLDLAGQPLIVRILERVKRVRSIDAIVLATPDTPEDDVLADVARDCGVGIFRGSEHDLVDRYYQAAKAFGAGTVLRLPADNPCSEPEAFELLIDAHRRSGRHFSSNIMQVGGNEWPDGIGVEAFGFDALETIWRTVHDPSRREHVASNFYDYLEQRPADPARFSTGTVPCPPGWRRPDLVLDVNTAQEYEFIRQLYEELHPRNHRFHITDIIDWYDRVYRRGTAGELHG